MTTWQRVAAVSGQPAFSSSAILASRALTSASPVALPIAALMGAVTSEIAVTTSACWPGHLRSSPSAAAVKPLATRSSLAVERFCAQSTTQWWLVRISPVAETKLAEQPPVSRTAAPRTRSSQA